jgi:hypothetical protein
MLPPDIIDGLKLIGEKLDEAVADRHSQRGAIVEAAGAVPANGSLSRRCERSRF